MPDAKAFVEKIRGEIEADRKSRLWKDSINMLSTVSESIFSRSAHFILELLQNAEDACSRIRNSSGEIRFCIYPDQIKVSHNGAPFDEGDVDAICGVRSSKNPEQETLGYLGIGFKSVFKVSDCPQVHSGGFHFKFDKSAYGDPAEEPWQIIPIWFDNPAEPQDPGTTTFILPFGNPDADKQILSELRKLDVSIFLFLKWLKRLEVIDGVSGQTTSIEHLGGQNRIVSLRKDGLTSQFVVFRRVSPVAPSVANDPALEFYKRKKVKHCEIVIAFGVDNGGNLQPLEDASTLGSVSSFLPLVEERSGAKFLMQSDFLVQPGREAIQYELSWNHWLVREAAELAKEAVEEFKQHPAWKRQFLPVFDFSSYPGQPAFEKLFKPSLHEPLTAYLNGAQVYPTNSGQHVRAEQAVHVDEPLKELLTDGDLLFLFPGRKDLLLADSMLDIKQVPGSIRSLSKAVTLAQVARNKALLEEKAKQPNPMDWFVKFYKAMAESGRDFKLVQGQDRRGRIIFYDDPIYIIIDKNVIVRSDSAYLREIPQDVLNLRSRFPEVDLVLSAYQHVHPDLGKPELTQFFREHTHVKSVDYDKICREVFLPKLSVNAVPPSKDEMIAYTRLLQKGPTVHDEIWVVTSGGNIKPSGQVFLGAAYSPAENWEAHSSYSPQIDFLSADYLQGVAQPEVPAWKEFLSKIKLKDRGDNPYVRDFAMEFVKAQLATELRAFVPKDHQQQGYDLEAIRLSDGSTVCLEVKGQKREGPIELVGNEPLAAEQAKQKGQAFWLVVVPGIPENPQLWVIEDPLAVGEHKIVSIDVTKWRNAGRRVV